jgi:hypothetical protein
MKSKFRFWAYFVVFFTVNISFLLFITIFSKLFNEMNPFVFGILYVFLILIWIGQVFGELRTKAIYINIECNSILVKGYLGLGASQIFFFDVIDGYKTSIITLRSNSYEYLYLMVGNKKVVKLSEYYHKNYAELKQMIIDQDFKSLGFENHSSINEIKEIFS